MWLHLDSNIKSIVGQMFYQHMLSNHTRLMRIFKRGKAVLRRL